MGLRSAKSQQPEKRAQPSRDSASSDEAMSDGEEKKLEEKPKKSFAQIVTTTTTSQEQRDEPMSDDTCFNNKQQPQTNAPLPPFGEQTFAKSTSSKKTSKNTMTTTNTSNPYTTTKRDDEPRSVNTFQQQGKVNATPSASYFGLDDNMDDGTPDTSSHNHQSHSHVPSHSSLSRPFQTQKQEMRYDSHIHDFDSRSSDDYSRSQLHHHSRGHSQPSHFGPSQTQSQKQEIRYRSKQRSAQMLAEMWSDFICGLERMENRLGERVDVKTEEPNSIAERHHITVDDVFMANQLKLLTMKGNLQFHTKDVAQLLKADIIVWLAGRKGMRPSQTDQLAVEMIKVLEGVAPKIDLPRKERKPTGEELNDNFGKVNYYTYKTEEDDKRSFKEPEREITPLCVLPKEHIRGLPLDGEERLNELSLL